MTVHVCYLCSVSALNRIVQQHAHQSTQNQLQPSKMKIPVTELILVLAVTITICSSASVKKMKKTKLDYRIIRSPTHHTETSSAYVLSSQANTEEKQTEGQQPVSLLSESQYEALLKQAQKALQGYDLSKLAASVENQNYASPVTEPAPVVYKPQYKFVYAAAAPEPAKSVTHNTAPAAYGAYSSSHDQHDHHEDYYSKHKFGYRVHDPHTGAAFGHSEVSEGHVTRGHYHVLLPDGRLQNVKYVADPSGYHATVTYETYKHV